MRLAFIGGGAMAEAIIGGVLSNGLAGHSEIAVGEVVKERRQLLEQRHKVYVTADNQEASQKGEVVVLAIKPQQLAEAMSQLNGSIRGSQAVLSIVAGAKTATISQGLGTDSVIRVMPNTPAQIGAGMSIWTCSPKVDEEKRQITREILGSIGEEIYVSDEKYVDMATALSASGPAYVFVFIESLIEAGVYLGLPRDMARTLAVQTVLGSARLAKESGRDPADLRAMVTSPGGTTSEALLALEEGGFRASVINAVVAAYAKSIELGEQQ